MLCVKKSVNVCKNENDFVILPEFDPYNSNFGNEKFNILCEPVNAVISKLLCFLYPLKRGT